MASKRIKSGTIQVEGLVELGKALRDLGPEFAKELRQTNKDVASFVADDARAAGYALGGVAAKAAQSVKASAGIRSAGVSFGGAGFEFAAGAEFGGQGKPTTQQFQPYRGSGPGAGYWAYPTISRDADQIEEKYTDAVNKVIERNFPY